MRVNKFIFETVPIMLTTGGMSSDVLVDSIVFADQDNLNN